MAPLVRPPGNLRTSQHFILALTARAVNWDDLGWLGICLVFSQEQWVGPIRHSLTAPGTPDAWITPAFETSELYSLGSTGVVQLLARYQNYLMHILARMEICWWPKSIILWPYKQQHQVRPFELSCSTAGCAQHLPLNTTSLRALKLLSSKLPSLMEPGLNYRDPSLLEAQPLSIEKNCFKLVFRLNQGEFLTDAFTYAYSSCARVCVNQFKS